MFGCVKEIIEGGKTKDSFVPGIEDGRYWWGPTTPLLRHKKKSTSILAKIFSLHIYFCDIEQKLVPIFLCLEKWVSVHVFIHPHPCKHLFCTYLVKDKLRCRTHFKPQHSTPKRPKLYPSHHPWPPWWAREEGLKHNLRATQVQFC